ncbi:hypothetical protein [Cytobacillus firmus]|uniref:hypothetical protein n=1 Tax=Cytobacillus firmus TaxID=1399 RepID=UPI001C8D7075|nr:hypothetical protein [Cytobacillus firmus]MBX9975084.1 hypothetical protein [Cytobacillus firmus]
MYYTNIYSIIFIHYHIVLFLLHDINERTAVFGTGHYALIKPGFMLKAFPSVLNEQQMQGEM